MRNITLMTLLLLSAPGTIHAQTVTLSRSTGPGNRGADQLFELPAHKTSDRFYLDLDKGNRMVVEVGDLGDVARFNNMDSLLLVFLADMRPFKDSLADPLTTKQIDYVIDASGKKKLRIRCIRPEGSGFLLEGNEPAALKTEQDTIRLLFITELPPSRGKRNNPGYRYNRLSFYINRYSELEGYVTTGLNQKIVELQKNVETRRWAGHMTWGTDNFKDGRSHMTADPAWTVDLRHGYPNPLRDYLTFGGSVNIQNYKNYFSPSLSLGMMLHFDRTPSIHEFAAFWEPQFFFTTNGQGRLQTYRNDFVTISYRLHGTQAPPEAGREEKEKDGLTLAASFSFLVRRSGDYFAPNSFRLGIGRVSIFHGGTFLEPCLYFHDLFKEVTPGLRFIQRF